VCGVISSYLTGEHPGPANYVNLLAKTATMQGFNALDEWGRFDEAFGPLREWAAEAGSCTARRSMMASNHASMR